MQLDRRHFVAGSLAALAALRCAGSGSRPPRRGAAPEPRSVVVIGAGLCGLTIALELTKRRVAVTVLEAQSRPGGRILTLRSPFRAGQRVEAGAKHVVGDAALLALCREVGVRVVKPQRPPQAKTRIRYFNGQRLIGRERAAGEAPPLSPVEASLSFPEQLRRYFAVVDGWHPGSSPVPRQLHGADQLSAAEYLKMQGASAGFQEMVRTSLVPNRDLERSSALALLRDVASLLRELGQKGGGRIEGGTDKLPQALARQLRAHVEYAAVVQRIDQSDGGVRVHFTQRGHTEMISASYAVCALPYSVARRIAFFPALSPLKQRAIKEQHTTSVARVWLQASKRFWYERGEAARVASDLGVGSVREETADSTAPAGILGIYAAGERARQLCSAGESALVQRASQDVEKLHPGLQQHLVAGAAKCWDADPYARGAYAWFSPRQLTEFGAALAAPEGRIHFAGDHVSDRPGFMHGAVSAAQRTVRELARLMG